jgi:hypothetical protein
MGSDHGLDANQYQRDIKFESSTQGTKGKSWLVSVTISRSDSFELLFLFNNNIAFVVHRS